MRENSTSSQRRYLELCNHSFRVLLHALIAQLPYVLFLLEDHTYQALLGGIPGHAFLPDGPRLVAGGLYLKFHHGEEFFYHLLLRLFKRPLDVDGQLLLSHLLGLDHHVYLLEQVSLLVHQQLHLLD